MQKGEGVEENIHLDRHADGDEKQVEQEDVGDVLHDAVLGKGEKGEYPPCQICRWRRGAGRSRRD